MKFSKGVSENTGVILTDLTKLFKVAQNTISAPCYYFGYFADNYVHNPDGTPYQPLEGYSGHPKNNENVYEEYCYLIHNLGEQLEYQKHGWKHGVGNKSYVVVHYTEVPNLVDRVGRGKLAAVTIYAFPLEMGEKIAQNINKIIPQLKAYMNSEQFIKACPNGIPPPANVAISGQTVPEQATPGQTKTITYKYNEKLHELPPQALLQVLQALKQSKATGVTHVKYFNKDYTIDNLLVGVQSLVDKGNRL